MDQGVAADADEDTDVQTDRNPEKDDVITAADNNAHDTDVVDEDFAPPLDSGKLDKHYKFNSK